VARNPPLGEDRDFSITPVVTTMLKAVGLFAAAIFWAMLLTYAARYKYLPDNWLGVGIVLGPSLVLSGISAAFLLKGKRFGGESREWTRVLGSISSYRGGSEYRPCLHQYSN
jgi:hypothetical protein